MREEHPAHDPVVRDLCFAQSTEPFLREADVEAASVVGIGGALEQAELGEPIDRSGDPAGAEIAAQPELADRQPAPRRPDEHDHECVGVDAEAVLAEQSPVELAEHLRVNAQHPPPGGELLGGERVRLGRLLEPVR